MQRVNYVLTIVAIMVGVPSMASFQNDVAVAVGDEAGVSRTLSQWDWTSGWLFSALALCLVSRITLHGWLQNRGRRFLFHTFALNAAALAYWLIMGVIEGLHRRLFPGL